MGRRQRDDTWGSWLCWRAPSAPALNREGDVMRTPMTAASVAGVCGLVLPPPAGPRMPCRRRRSTDVIREPRGRAVRARPADLSLRHLRRRGVLGRHAQAAPGHRRRGQGGVGPGVSPGRRWRSVSRSTWRRCRHASSRPSATAASTSNDPAVTLALLDANAVVGVKGFRGADGRLSSVGIQCSLCHSTVDDSFAPGVGRRLDGWPNRDLNVGAIIALAPDLGRGGRLCCRPIRPRSARSSGAGAPGSSTRNCSSTARRSGRTAAARPRSFPRRSGWPASTSRPTRGGAVSRTGTRSSPTSRCTVRVRSWTRG